jgi:predicted GIY-YIG superfamily endonuclease
MTDTQSTPFVNTPEILYRLRAANGDLLYVGITRDFPSRLKQHYADKPWAYEIRSTEQVHIDGTRAQIEAIEKAVIIAEKPRHNKTHNAEVRRTLAAAQSELSTVVPRLYAALPDVDPDTADRPSAVARSLNAARVPPDVRASVTLLLAAAATEWTMAHTAREQSGDPDGPYLWIRVLVGDSHYTPNGDSIRLTGDTLAHAIRIPS